MTGVYGRTLATPEPKKKVGFIARLFGGGKKHPDPPPSKKLRKGHTTSSDDDTEDGAVSYVTAKDHLSKGSATTAGSNAAAAGVTVPAMKLNSHSGKSGRAEPPTGDVDMPRLDMNAVIECVK